MAHAIVVLLVAGLAISCQASRSGPIRALLGQPVTGAAFSTVNEGVDGVGNPAYCKNGNPGVNCNIYTGKDWVWTSGGPLAATMGDGRYFFAVVEPGGQNQPNDFIYKRNGDLLTNTNLLSEDVWTNRVFTITNTGSVPVFTYTGSHDFAPDTANNNVPKIRLMPYRDTSNMGGEYILVVCKLATAATVQPVDASECKYDAYKIVDGSVVIAGDPPAPRPTVEVTLSPAYKRTWTWGIAKDADKTTVTDAIDTTATFTYTVAVTHDAGTPSAVVVSGTVKANNPNSEDVIATVGVSTTGPPATCTLYTDDTFTALLSQPVTLPKDETTYYFKCDYGATLPGASDEWDITATVTYAQQTLGAKVLGAGSSTDLESVILSDFESNVIKVDDCVDVTDTVQGSLGQVCDTAASPSQLQYNRDIAVKYGCYTYDNTATYKVVDTAVDTGATGSSTKTVTVCGSSKQPTISLTAAPAYTTTWPWNIAKAVDATTVTKASGTATFNYQVTVGITSPVDSNQKVTGTVTVTNQNPTSMTVESVTVTSTIGSGQPTTCTVTNGGQQPLGPSAGAGAVIKPTYTCTYSSTPASTPVIVATVTWATQDLDAPTAAVEGGSPSTAKVPLAGGSVTATDSTSAVFNAAVQTKVDDCVVVTDTYRGTTTTLGTVCQQDTLPKTFPSYSNTIDVLYGCYTYDNTATYKVVDTAVDTGATGFSTKTVTVCGSAKQPTISLTAAPAYTTTWTWNIAKTVTSPTKVTRISGTATFNYQVVVGITSAVDSNQKVTGTVTVTNQNPKSMAISSVTVTSKVGTNAATACTVANGGSQILGASAIKPTYTCTYSSTPASTPVIVATVTWATQDLDAPTAAVAGGSPSTAKVTLTGGSVTATDSTSAVFNAAVQTKVDDCVAVTDTFNGATNTLGTICSTDTSVPKTYSYSRTVNIPANGCQTYDNTATFTTDDSKPPKTGSSSKSIQACGPALTGARTIGYWRNNGQNIITGQAASGTCPSATWLRTYNPFKDLSSTANCQAVADYFTTLFLAANSSGDSMNAMLKVQMLATALDVYFSDPALGGIKLSAPAPIGGLLVDLTKICKPGSLTTCWSNAVTYFGGGSTSKTVTQLLTAAASQSTSGGGTWYGNIKTPNQETVKDTFDAINNEKVIIVNKPYSERQAASQRLEPTPPATALVAGATAKQYPGGVLSLIKGTTGPLPAPTPSAGDIPPACDGLWVSSGTGFDLVASVATGEGSCEFTLNPTTGNATLLAPEHVTGSLTTYAGNPIVFDAATSAGNYTTVVSDDTNGTFIAFYPRNDTAVVQAPTSTWMRASPFEPPATAFNLSARYTSDNASMICMRSATAPGVYACHFKAVENEDVDSHLILIQRNESAPTYNTFDVITDDVSWLVMKVSDDQTMLYFYDPETTQFVPANALLALKRFKVGFCAPTNRISNNPNCTII